MKVDYFLTYFTYVRDERSAYVKQHQPNNQTNSFSWAIASPLMKDCGVVCESWEGLWGGQESWQTNKLLWLFLKNFWMKEIDSWQREWLICVSFLSCMVQRLNKVIKRRTCTCKKVKPTYHIKLYFLFIYYLLKCTLPVLQL